MYIDVMSKWVYQIQTVDYALKLIDSVVIIMLFSLRGLCCLFISETSLDMVWRCFRFLRGLLCSLLSSNPESVRVRRCSLFDFLSRAFLLASFSSANLIDKCSICSVRLFCIYSPICWLKTRALSFSSTSV
jgi:hypothetical protein